MPAIKSSDSGRVSEELVNSGHDLGVLGNTSPRKITTEGRGGISGG